MMRRGGRWRRRDYRPIWKHFCRWVLRQIKHSRGQVDLESILMLKSNSWGESDIKPFDYHVGSFSEHLVMGEGDQDVVCEVGVPDQGEELFSLGFCKSSQLCSLFTFKDDSVAFVIPVLLDLLQRSQRVEGS